ncbi:hypothetical protein K435DRAFT_965861 [Dendrothele bispora CBS 962.96]|uniref:Uncharacterized protein n=1 Tax=Dendrothele bispora (strain CBS 962.96) TaxID=1314807 RepID=A0A4S8M445_DENBC|nr:hypothetical protein K435DRAFT_965861 [Dendrothele bispora CBS 962.96]
MTFSSIELMKTSGLMDDIDEASLHVYAGVEVAVWTFTKAAYRLGETVKDAVELNEQTSRARVLVELPAHLETHESLPNALTSAPSSGSPATRQPKRIYAEDYSSFVLSTRDPLDIPSGASTAFQIKLGAKKLPAGRACSAHETSAVAASMTVYSRISVILLDKSASLYPHSPLSTTPIILTVPASAPAYPSTFSVSSPSSPAFPPSSP